MKKIVLLIFGSISLFYSCKSSKMIELNNAELLLTKEVLDTINVYSTENLSESLKDGICVALKNDVSCTNIIAVFQGEKTAIYKVGCINGANRRSCTHASYAYLLFVIENKTIIVTNYTDEEPHLELLKKLKEQETSLTENKYNILEEKVLFQVKFNKDYEKNKNKTF
jgi:hypothetical protein